MVNSNRSLYTKDQQQSLSAEPSVGHNNVKMCPQQFSD